MISLQSICYSNSRMFHFHWLIAITSLFILCIELGYMIMIMYVEGNGNGGNGKGLDKKAAKELHQIGKNCYITKKRKLDPYISLFFFFFDAYLKEIGTVTMYYMVLIILI